MLDFDLQTLAEITNGKLVGENPGFQTVSIDSRAILERCLFIPIKGERFDGQDFIEAAFDNNAIAALTEKPIKTQKPYVLVENTRLALGLLAAAQRQRFKKPVLGLTGSLGKTTTKALIAAILRQKHEVLSPEVSMNNDIGLPLTLLDMADQDFAVIEMGTNHFGEIPYLANITKPDVALITNIGAAHLEHFKDLAGVAKEKSAIFAGLARNGTAVVNADDLYSEGFKKAIGSRKTISFGYCKTADVRAENIKLNELGQASFQLVTVKYFGEINLQCYGEHNVKNALAAVAAASLYDIPFEDVKTGLESVQAVTKRLMRRPGLNGSTIIDDSYSAIPEAVTAALKVLACAKGKKIFVFGGMAELNKKDAISIHEKIGRQAQELGVDELIVIGDLAKHTAGTFGMAKQFDNKQELITYTKTLLADDVTILVKGSRGMRLEEVVANLVRV